MKYIRYNGLEREEIHAGSVGVVLEDGTEFELRFRHSDGEVMLSVAHANRLMIEPKANNLVHLWAKK